MINESVQESSNLPSGTALLLGELIRDRCVRIGVIGLGDVGLPLIRAFVAARFRTIGFDIDQAKVDSLLAGRSYIEHIPSSWIEECINRGKFEPTADMGRLGEAHVILICAPTPLNDTRDPDLEFIQSTARQIAATLREGQLVVLESTTYPGTTLDVMLPILAQKGLTAGTDYFVAFRAEREDPGNPTYTAHTIPRVVGGIDPVSGKLAQYLYEQAVVR